MSKKDEPDVVSREQVKSEMSDDAKDTKQPEICPSCGGTGQIVKRPRGRPRKDD